MNVIIYCRVSSDEQAKGGSLDFQEKTLREYCRRNGHNIVDVYREDASGKDFEHRPEINKIMKYCKSHKQEVDLIIVLRWDRYSRNQRLAYINLDFFKSLNIEVNASEQYVDYSVPESKLQLAVYLSMAEVDNDKRSIGTMDGIHQTLSEGRCSNKAPRGYKNVKIDDYNKYVEIDKVKAPIIQWVFSEVAKGTQSPNYIRRLVERKHNWKINKNSFMDMLRNRFYVGKVRVPEYKGIPEHYVDGKHDAIIDKVTFEKVQEIIDGKKKGSPKLSKKINPDLFLRKYICCPICGKSITGATSSGNGGKYTYYNCSSDAKHFRCRAEDANELFAKYLSSLKPNEPILRLYKEVLKDIRQDGKLDVQKQIEGHRDEILKIKERLYNLEDKYLDGDIDKETYHNAKGRYAKNISTLEEKIDILENPNRANIEPKLTYSIDLINNMDYYIRDAKVEVKCKLISSIFPEKVAFDGKVYRTNSLNKVLDLIYQQTNELRGNKKGKNPNNSSFSHLVPRAALPLFYFYTSKIIKIYYISIIYIILKSN